MKKKEREERKREIERMQAEAAIAFLSELDEKAYHLDEKRPEPPDFTFSDGEGNLCGAIEVTSSAEYMQEGKNDFKFDAIFDEFRNQLKKQVETQSNLIGEYTLEGPWPCDLPMPKKQKMWQEFLYKVLEAIQEFASDPDGHRLRHFYFDGLEFRLILESRDGSSINVAPVARFTAPPGPEDLRRALDHIVESLSDDPGMKLGLIEVFRWPAVHNVDPVKLAIGLKREYPDIDRLLLIQRRVSPAHPNWKQFQNYELLKVW